MAWFRGVGLFVSAFFAGMAVMAFVHLPPTQSSDWASWVQAVGSIAAIIGSFMLARHQEAREISRRDDAERKTALLHAKAAKVVGQDALDAIRAASVEIGDFVPAKPFSHDLDRLYESQLALRSLLDRPLPIEVFAEIVLLQRLVIYSIRAIRQRQGTQLKLKGQTRRAANVRREKAESAVNRIAHWVGAQG